MLWFHHHHLHKQEDKAVYDMVLNWRKVFKWSLILTPTCVHLASNQLINPDSASCLRNELPYYTIMRWPFKSHLQFPFTFISHFNKEPQSFFHQWPSNITSIYIVLVSFRSLNNIESFNFQVSWNRTSHKKPKFFLQALFFVRLASRVETFLFLSYTAFNIEEH